MDDQHTNAFLVNGLQRFTMQTMFKLASFSSPRGFDMLLSDIVLHPLRLIMSLAIGGQIPYSSGPVMLYT